MNFKKNSAITLIALVITIIVLLLLAGVFGGIIAAFSRGCDGAIYSANFCCLYRSATRCATAA